MLQSMGSQRVGYGCCDNVSHFRTQLPYALISAGIAAVLYQIVGIFI